MLPKPLTDQLSFRPGAALSLLVEEAADSVAEEVSEAVVSVPVLLLLEPDLLTRAESLLSSVKEALTEDAFLHSLGASAEPLTKLAAMH
jgi:hypothetical protein